jgi:hypothetical protein
MAFLKLTNMELTDDEKIDQSPWLFPKSDEDRAREKLATPEYPYGLRISLCEAEFEKLGLAPEDAFVGAICHGHFLARVTSVSCCEGPEGKTARVELQIEDLNIESEDEEDGEVDRETKNMRG